MVTYTFTIVAMASASCRVFNTFCDPAVLWLYLQMVFMLVYLQHSEEFVPHEWACYHGKRFTQQQMEGCSGFVFSGELQHSVWLHCCFRIFWTVSDMVYKHWYLANLWHIFYLKGKLVLQAWPFLF